MTSENCTYFQSSGTETGACNAKICPKHGVCQLRLDFSKFDIGQPSKSIKAIELVLAGTVLSTQCGNFLTFLSHTFYVKSILRILEAQNVPL